MTPEKQRIAIAEACGWDSIGMFNGNPHQPAGFPPGINTRPESLPDYLNDLNAMHEAEKAIPDHLRWQYSSNVTDIVRRCAREAYDFMSSLTATAPQRAKALLRIIGKWEES